MKKLLSMLLTILLTLAPLAGLAEAAPADSSTQLPCGVSFRMDMTELNGLLGSDVQREAWYEDDDETGSLMLEVSELGIGTLTAAEVSFEINRNNSANAPRLCQVSATLPVGENVVSSFKAALEAMTATYGAPDGDPFDEYGVQTYVEYGNLSATWTKADVRINLDMNRMYDESLQLTFSSRINYDAADLE